MVYNLDLSIKMKANQLIRLEVLRALVGHIPPHPLWAELLWQRQEEISKRMASGHQSLEANSPPDPSRRLQQR